MIKMVKAKDLKLGMKISTDRLEIRCLRYVGLGYEGTKRLIFVGGVVGVEWKQKAFNQEDELPIYYDDSNGGED